MSFHRGCRITTVATGIALVVSILVAGPGLESRAEAPARSITTRQIAAFMASPESAGSTGTRPAEHSAVVVTTRPLDLAQPPLAFGDWDEAETR